MAGGWKSGASKKRIRVLFCECGERGGSVRQLTRLLRTLDRSRVEMGFISYYRTGAASQLFQAPGLFCRYSLPFQRSPAPDMERYF